ncbi:MAG: DNA polymerase III subunit delta [Spirochaetota bacterium]
MRVDPIYILAGPDAGRRALFITELKRELAARGGIEPEGHRLYAGDCPVGELLSLALNGSLFSEQRIIEYRDAELAKSKDDLAALGAYAAHPSEGVVLLLVTETFGLDRSLEDAVGKDRKKTFFELFENEKPRWIARRLGEAGIDIDDDAIETLLELVENDTAALDSTCARLSLVFPRGSRLGAEDIEAAISRNRQEDAFSLFARMVSDEPDWALECLDAVLADRQGGAVQLIAALVWSWRRFLRLRLLLDDGESFDTACLKSGIKAKSLQALHRDALGRYSREACERILALLADFDARARSGGAQLERGLLQLLIYGIMVKKGDLRLDALWR